MSAANARPLVVFGTAVAAIAALLLGAAAAPPSAPSGEYTRAQATTGQLVYIEHCLKCHGGKLQGAEAPPLQGPVFGRSLTKGKMTTAASLYRLIYDTMPFDAPRTLTKGQYLAVTAYLLNKNAYAPGGAPLTESSAGRARLLPYPNLVPDLVPFDAAAPPSGTVPSDAAVALDDAQLHGAANDAKDWRLPGRTYENWRYSPLAQIDRGNVHALELVKIVHTGMFASFETTPIVAGGVMYITTPTVKHVVKVMALNAATGDTLWSRTLQIGTYKSCCGPNNRGAALAYGNLYLATLDDRLVALDARTGATRWQTTVADASLGYSESMQPQVVDGLVIVGSAGAEWAIRGFVAAYDARTGAQRWRWYTTDPKTFAGDSWKRGGGTVWTTPAIDPAQHLVIFGTANPNPDLDGSVRLGDNLYTDSIVALDVRSGKLRWYYQEVKHDLWDYDATSNVVLFDVHVNGRTIPAAGQASKVGWFFIVDRRTGKLLRKSQPFVQQANLFRIKFVLPGGNGGSEWSPPAYSPQTHAVYVLGINQLTNYYVHHDPDRPGSSTPAACGVRCGRRRRSKRGRSPRSTSRPGRSCGSTRRRNR